MDIKVNKIYVFILLFFIAASVCADEVVTPTAACASVTGTAFPKITAQTLDDKEIVLPDAVQGKASMIILTFSRPDDNDMASWIKPFALKYMGNTQKAYYEMALVGDVGILNGMKGGATEDQKAHLLVF